MTTRRSRRAWLSLMDGWTALMVRDKHTYTVPCPLSSTYWFCRLLFSWLNEPLLLSKNPHWNPKYATQSGKRWRHKYYVKCAYERKLLHGVWRSSTIDQWGSRSMTKWWYPATGFSAFGSKSYYWFLYLVHFWICKKAWSLATCKEEADKQD